jgi:hypothetical protein
LGVVSGGFRRPRDKRTRFLRERVRMTRAGNARLVEVAAGWKPMVGGR